MSEAIKRANNSAKYDGVTGAVASFQNASKSIPLPDGVRFRNDEEQVIWDQFTRARPVDSWRDFDLLLLFKMTQIEYDIRNMQKRLEEQGPIIENKRGTPIENPLFRIIDALMRQQLAIIRSMSLNQTFKDPRTLNRKAKAEEDAAKLIKEQGIEGLLATPMH